MGSSVRLGDLLKVSVAGLSVLPRFLAPSPMLATPLLSGPDKSPEEGWQDHIQLRGLQTCRVVLWLSSDGGDDWWEQGERER